MARRRYHKTESWNRILRSFEGVANPSDAPGSISGELLPEEEVLSDLAELFESSLPDQTGTLPPGITVPIANLPVASTAQKGIIEIATAAEAYAGASSTLAVTPIGLATSLSGTAVYGQIYSMNTTGTSHSLVTGTWATVTGFTNNGPASGMTPDKANNQLVITQRGTYLIAWGMSVRATAGSETNFHVQAYLDSVLQTPVSAKQGITSTLFTAQNLSATGFVNVTGTPVNLSLRVLSVNAPRIFHVEDMQLIATRFGVER